MIDHKIDEQLLRLSRAAAETSPEAPALPSPERRRTSHPVRDSSWGFGAAMVLGAAILAIAWWGSSWDETAVPVGDDAGSRWDWVIGQSEPTDDADLWVADPAAIPVPTFDYATLGEEQRVTFFRPEIPWLDFLARDESLAPWVYVGTVSETAAYLFESDGAPVLSTLEDGTVVPVVCLTVTPGSDLHCFPDGEPAAGDGLIAGVGGVASGDPQGNVTVSMWLPRNTAVAVLRLDDGRTFVQRPVAGVALFVIGDLGGAGIESAEALSATGESIGREEFAARWESLVTEAELSERCQEAGHVVATYQALVSGVVLFDNAWMVESADPSLEAWYFISATVQGGPMDGQIATWQFPAFGGSVDQVNTPRLSIPANDVAASFDIGTDPVLLSNVVPAAYGFEDWSEVEGFELSQACIGLSAEVP